MQFPLCKERSLKEFCIVSLVRNKLSFETVSDDLKSDIQTFLQNDAENRYTLLKGFLTASTNAVNSDQNAQVAMV